MLLINHLLMSFFVLTSSWRGYNILKGRSNSNFQNLTWIRLKVCNFFSFLFSLFINTNFYFLLNYSVINNQEAECGYYIMQWMITIVRLGLKSD